MHNDCTKLAVLLSITGSLRRAVAGVLMARTLAE
jgi:hypothetical protein